jgi:ABC-type glycerol-3-phosphate transport system permease component
MSIILPCERRTLKSRLLIGLMYLLLVLGGATMIYPFLITVSSSLTNKFEYNRFRAWPRSVGDRSERFVRSLVLYFYDYPSSLVFPDRSPTWASWTSVGESPALVQKFAAPFLAVEKDQAKLARWRLAAADFALFNLEYDIRNTTCNYDARDLAGFLQGRYERLDLKQHPEAGACSRAERRDRAIKELRADWEIPFPSFFDIDFVDERAYPMHHLSWDYPQTAQARLYLEFKDAYRCMEFRPGAERQWRAFAKQRGVSLDSVSGWPVPRNSPQWSLFCEFVAATAPASPTLPFLLKDYWLKFLDRPESKKSLGLDPAATFMIADYNRLFGGTYANLTAIPFPLPAGGEGRLRQMWDEFVVQAYPRRLMTVKVTPELETRYQASLRETYRTIAAYNTLSDTTHPDFTALRLLPYENSADWRKFAGTLASGDFELRSAEGDYQAFLLKKYGSLEAINRTYGWTLGRIEEAFPPVAQAMAVTFFQNEWRYFLHDLGKNYVAVFDFMAVRGRAFVTTTIYIMIVMLLSLTINPLAAYALSRFKLRWTEQILLFLLATMAFPGAVTAIPSFLLLRDLHLLNTFYALFLPGVANGMAIFILKCFFDGLPRELYEAATIDGAREWQIFLNISLPMITPILAVNALNAFIAAYNSWEWALLVCQKESYWTIAVWLYQLSQTATAEPWMVMAAFVAASLPVALIFIGCQKIILRGIVIPAMK